MSATTPVCRTRSIERMETTAVMASDRSGRRMTYLKSEEEGAGSVEGRGLLFCAGESVPFRPDSSAGAAAFDCSGEALTDARVVGGMVARKADAATVCSVQDCTGAGRVSVDGSAHHIAAACLKMIQPAPANI